MDNFEWAVGFQQRFGMVHVDFQTQKRTLKESTKYFRKVADANAALLPSQNESLLNLIAD